MRISKSVPGFSQKTLSRVSPRRAVNPSQFSRPKGIPAKWAIAGGLGLAAGGLGVFTSYEMVSTGSRGVQITLGQPHPVATDEGVQWKWPFFTSRIEEISARQVTDTILDECLSSDMQKITVELKVLWRVSDGGAVNVVCNYEGDFEHLFPSFIEPRVTEALMEEIAIRSAEETAENRQAIQAKTREHAREKLGADFEIVEVVIQDMKLTDDMNHAINDKMVAQQEAERAWYSQKKEAEDAKSRVIHATGEAEGMVIRAATLQQNPEYLMLQLLEKWNGQPPKVMGNAGGVNVLVPTQGQKEK